ncbi:MAG: TIGR02281 family clan AA aspartic protease [Pseudomonadales bacterium]
MAKHSNCITVLLSLVCATAFAAPDIRVNGLMPNQAVVTIDGKQRILKVGTPSPEGVSLVSADSQKAVLEWQGERLERALTREISSNYTDRAEEEARIQRGRDNHFFTAGSINGQPVSFMVDTGAFAIAMTPAEADRLRLNWRQGERFVANTAGGGTPSYKVTLDSVSVGGITLHNIAAAVIVSDSAGDILLGMSFLEKTEMREENNTLVLRKKY